MSSSRKEKHIKDDPVKGWRGVVYVCYRPKSEFSFDELRVLEDCLRNNRGTNHWATRVFSLSSKSSYGGENSVSPQIQKLIQDP